MVIEYDQEIPQSQTADKDEPMAPQGRATPQANQPAISSPSR